MFDHFLSFIGENEEDGEGDEEVLKEYPHNYLLFYWEDIAFKLKIQ
jgi:hypothetical protein